MHGSSPTGARPSPGRDGDVDWAWAARNQLPQLGGALMAQDCVRAARLHGREHVPLATESGVADRVDAMV